MEERPTRAVLQDLCSREDGDSAANEAFGVTPYRMFLALRFTPEQARALADAGYTVLGWVPVGMIPAQVAV